MCHESDAIQHLPGGYGDWDEKRTDWRYSGKRENMVNIIYWRYYATGKSEQELIEKDDEGIQKIHWRKGNDIKFSQK